MLNYRESGYFNSLPEAVKTDVLHSGVAFKDENELNSYVSIFMRFPSGNAFPEKMSVVSGYGDDTNYYA